MQPDPAWTAGPSWSSPDQGLHETIGRIASARPQALALISGTQTVTYGELDRLAGSWSSCLADAGLAHGDRVPIVLPRGVDIVVALLAVLKAGCAYALLDPAWPADRLADVIARLASPVVIAEAGTVDLPSSRVWSPSRAPSRAASAAGPGRSDWRIPVRGTDACCVFFTSGTTGRPKGVTIAHKAIARLFQRGTFADFGPDTVVPLAAPAPWDAFALELFAALLSGGTSVIIDEPYLSASALRRSIATAGVNTVWLTTSLFNMILDEDPAAFGGLRQVMIGGERLSSTHVQRFLRKHGGILLLNGYGPVESTIFATTHEIATADCDRRDGIPLGRPVPGTRVLVLDGLRECAVGEEGEICIGGDGLALGYLGEPELTEAKFEVLDVGGMPRRVYRSGDLGAWASDGLLEYRGRMDRQVKIRGHRVEPANLERRLEELPTVRQCRVVARRDDSGAVVDLLAFCVPADPGDELAGAKTTLQALLPPYEQPSEVISVRRFPLTDQGKLDERALLAAAPRSAATIAADTDVPPDDALSFLVAETFAALLGRASVPGDVSFFALGGDSLAAGAVCARIGVRLSRAVSVGRLYQNPTAAGFADWLASPWPAQGRAEPDAEPGGAPLTPMQLVFLTRHLATPDDRTGHCLMVWRVDGEVDLAALESAIGYVHGRHEALRAAYVPDPRPSAVLADIPPPALEVMGAQASVPAAVRALRAAFAERLEIMEADVWRVGLVPVARRSTSILGCVVHHIAFDGWSEAILARDLSIGYARRPHGSPSQVLSLASAARHEAAHQAQADLPAQTDAVCAYLADTPQLRWPGQPAGPRAEPGHLSTAVSAALVADLDAVAALMGVTRFVVLLAQWANALATVTGQRDFSVGVPAAQRYGPLHEETIGCFLAIVCVRLHDAALDGGLAGIEATGQTVAQAFAHQHVPFTAVVEALRVKGSGRPPVFQALFALQDTPSPRLELAGLRVRLLPQPYLDLPLELHTEVWPERAGGLSIISSYRHDAVDARTAELIAELFERNLTTLARGGPC